MVGVYLVEVEMYLVGVGVYLVVEGVVVRIVIGVYLVGGVE